ncbi:GNL3L/Grn1 putative GTPase domain-containing protein [Phthorimaea operculella]|nr:GNL3L/Grn1 putative GTPase domain-containing protein [Phthorimaea operculella]
MAKFKLKKPSKRTPARLRYKIQKKVAEHNRKQKKEAKKNPKSKKPKVIQVPNGCPFKEDILKEVEAIKKHKEEERQKRKELAKLEKQKKMEEKKNSNMSMDSLVANAQTRGKVHDALKGAGTVSDDVQFGKDKTQENSLKTYYREFKKVISEAEVILEVVDARDPLGTRCIQVEEAVREAGKRLVVVLNKADLVPRQNLTAWLQYLRHSAPAVPFKASTQDQQHNLGRKKMKHVVKEKEMKVKADLVPRQNLTAWLQYLRRSAPAVPFKASTQDQQHNLGRKKMKHVVKEKEMKGSACVGAELLMNILGNYCRNKGIKTSLTVGIVGLPNVGKSSIINSLNRSKACNVGSTPGVTKQMQTVQLDSKIKLLDSPGIVFHSGSDSDASVALKNAIRVGSLKDPITPATAILQRANTHTLVELYEIPEFTTPQQFFACLASRMGRFKKGGVPDQEAAARILLNDWNTGKVRYFTEPPETPASDIHVDAKIVTSIAAEFDINSFEAMETEAISQLDQGSSIEPVKVTNLFYEIFCRIDPSDIHVDAKIVTSIAAEFDINSFEAMETEAISQLDQGSSIQPVKDLAKFKPPETPASDIHVDAKIVTSIAAEFDINSFEAMETEAISQLDQGSSIEPVKFVTYTKDTRTKIKALLQVQARAICMTSKAQPCAGMSQRAHHALAANVL